MDGEGKRITKGMGKGREKEKRWVREGRNKRDGEGKGK